MNSVELLDDIAETESIQSLLTDLAPLDLDGLPDMPTFPFTPTMAPPVVRRWSIGAISTGVFFKKANWINTVDYQSPRPVGFEVDDNESAQVSLPVEKRTMPIGSLSLAHFLTVVNWSNKVDQPVLPTFNAPGSATSAAGGKVVETFFSSFNWD